MGNDTNHQQIKKLLIVGDNFISKSLYDNYKRYGKIKVKYNINIDDINSSYDYIIDTTFNVKSQDLIIKKCNHFNIEKLLIVNHWKRNNLPKINTTIIAQAIVYDVYGYEHNSFYRQGSGNNYDTDIKYCTFISETIRRLHESKIYGNPITYINYCDDIIKYSYVDNIYEPINYMLNNINKNVEYCIYDNKKNVYNILNKIQELIEYNGKIVLTINKKNNNDKINSLELKSKKTVSFLKQIKKIYHYLIFNNDRFYVL